MCVYVSLLCVAFFEIAKKQQQKIKNALEEGR